MPGVFQKSPRETSTIFRRKALAVAGIGGPGGQETGLSSAGITDPGYNGEPANSFGYRKRQRRGLIFLLKRGDFFLRAIDLGFSAAPHGEEFLLAMEIQNRGIKFGLLLSGQGGLSLFCR